MALSEEIAKQKELLYLSALKVANSTLTEAEESGFEVSSGVLSASASLLKLKLDDVIESEVSSNDLFRDSLNGLILDNKVSMEIESNE